MDRYEKNNKSLIYKSESAQKMFKYLITIAMIPWFFIHLDPGDISPLRQQMRVC